MSKDNEQKFNIKEFKKENITNEALSVPVLAYAVKKGKVSIGKVQEHFGVGYARAAKVLSLLEENRLIYKDQKSEKYIPEINEKEFYKIFGKVDFDDEHHDDDKCHCKHNDSEGEHCCKGHKHDEFDDLYLDALLTAVKRGDISVSYVQRRFSVGYNTASAIIERMQKEGFIKKDEKKGYIVKATEEDVQEKYGDKIEHRQHEHEDHCDCGCEDHDDDEVIIEGFKDNKEFQKYEKAFRQLEDALIKADKELTIATKKAEENEHLAISYKKDLERYKERAKQQENEHKIKAIENVADKLIPILDNFEQALKVGGDKNTIKGFQMIEGMLKSAVKSLGIEEIEAEGKEFDPKIHNAVGKKKTSDKSKDNMVATVYQKGYKLEGSDRVIRHSTVEVYDAE